MKPATRWYAVAHLPSMFLTLPADLHAATVAGALHTMGAETLTRSSGEAAAPTGDAAFAARTNSTTMFGQEPRFRDVESFTILTAARWVAQGAGYLLYKGRCN